MDSPVQSVITVCGAGTMGSGIAQLFATAGYRVLLFDIREDALAKSLRQIGSDLQQREARGRLNPGEKNRILERLSFTTSILQCKASFCLEAIREDAGDKSALFCNLMEQNGPEAIYATNTSSLSVTGIAAGTPFPNRVAGMHFFNPAHLMKLVEVVYTDFTEPDVLDKIRKVASQIQKTAVLVKDTPGFIVNRVARPFYLESMRVAEEGAADFKSIDQLLESTGFKMGPFALTDLIGQDINLRVSQSLYAAFHQAPRFRPSPLQEQKVRDGDLGQKTGRGFYDYHALP